jgi:hypothetical protein
MESASSTSWDQTPYKRCPGSCNFHLQKLKPYCKIKPEFPVKLLQIEGFDEVREGSPSTHINGGGWRTIGGAA